MVACVMRHPYMQSMVTSAGVRSPISQNGEVLASSSSCGSWCLGTNPQCPEGCCYWWLGWLCSTKRIVVGKHCCKTSKGHCIKHCKDYGGLAAMSTISLLNRLTSRLTLLSNVQNGRALVRRDASVCCGVEPLRHLAGGRPFFPRSSLCTRLDSVKPAFVAQSDLRPWQAKG